ncbi:hypothetical protein [Hyphomonas sp.]|uniref:hypothetical protein n=1 Tax=Hyphomonas sp. TaxID=87 RepID=UPI003527E6C5
MNDSDHIFGAPLRAGKILNCSTTGFMTARHLIFPAGPEDRARLPANIGNPGILQRISRLRLTQGTGTVLERKLCKFTRAGT